MTVVKLLEKIQVHVTDYQTLASRQLIQLEKAVSPVQKPCQFISLRLLQKLPAIRLLLGYVLGNAHRSHELPLLIIERRLQGNHFPHAVLAHDMLPKAAGHAGLLHILLSFQADKPAELVFFLAESPDIVMLLSPDILLGFVDYRTKSIIDTPMLTITPLEPDKVHTGVNHRLQLQFPQPGILFQLQLLHQTDKEQLRRIKGQAAGPYIIHSCQLIPGHAGGIITANNAHGLLPGQLPDSLLTCTGRSLKNQDIRPLHINLPKAVRYKNLVGKPFQRLHRIYSSRRLRLQSYQIDIQVTLIHARLTPLIPQINVELSRLLSVFLYSLFN